MAPLYFQPGRLQDRKAQGRGRGWFPCPRQPRRVDAARISPFSTPALLQLTQVLRDALTPILHDGEKAELHATDSGTGLDLVLALRTQTDPGADRVHWPGFSGHGVARILFNNEILMEEGRPPPSPSRGCGSGFCRPRHSARRPPKAKRRCRSHVWTLTKGAKNINGPVSPRLGTFALALAKKATSMHARADAALLAALAAAAKRNLGRGGLSPPAKGAISRSSGR